MAQSARYVWDNARRDSGHFVIVQWTHSGEGRFLLDQQVHAVPAGRAFVAFVPEASRYFFPSGGRAPWTFSWLNFYGGLAREICRDLRAAFGPVLPLPPGSPAAGLFRRLAGRVASRRFSDRFETSAEAYAFLMEWTRQLDRPAGNPPDAVEALKRAFRTRFREPLGLKELADEAGLSREHLSRLFAERTGTPPALYLRRLRVAEARRLMREGAAPLAECALRSGFSSVRSLQRALAAARKRESGRCRRT